MPNLLILRKFYMGFHSPSHFILIFKNLRYLPTFRFPSEMLPTPSL